MFVVYTVMSQDEQNVAKPLKRLTFYVANDLTENETSALVMTSDLQHMGARIPRAVVSDCWLG